MYADAVLRGRLLLAGVMAAVVLGGAGDARAAGPVLRFAADAAGETGYVTLYLSGKPRASAQVFERVGPASLPIATAEFNDAGGFGGVKLERAVRWRCDRLTRHFVAVVTNTDATVEAAAFSVRTPSCRNRLSVKVPRAARRRARVKVDLRDRWRIGGVRGRLCTTAPGRPARCRGLRIPTGRARVTPSFRPGREGRWRVEVRVPGQRIRRALSVGERRGARVPAVARPTILATGNSLMQSIDALLGDRLAGRAEVESDIRVGAGLSLSLGVDWRRHARRQVARLHPDATVVFLGGGGDAYPLKTPAGPEVECCEEPWIAEYARRVRSVMRTYAQGGRGEVYWLAVPAPRDPRQRAPASAVNAAILSAAEDVPSAHVVRLDEVFTPAGEYRDAMLYRGRRLRVREGDGIHLNVQGAAIATSILIRELRRFGPL